MEYALNAAKSILSGLNEIQPGVSVCGLAVESAKIKGMKADVAELIGALTLDYPRLEKVVDSCFIDVCASFEALKNGIEKSSLEDEASLRILGLSAELFAKRCDEYLSSLESFRKLSDLSKVKEAEDAG